MKVKRNQAVSVRDLLPTRKKNPFLLGLSPSPLFSVEMEGADLRSFQKEISIRSRSTKREGTKETTRVLWVHPGSGLEAELEYSAFQDTGVIEVEGRLFNRGSQTVRKLRGPFSLRASIDLSRMGTPRLTTVYGGASVDGCYPPPSYGVREMDIPALAGVNLLGGRAGGRSTEADMPYAIIADPDTKSGFFVAMEWPCRWIIGINRAGTFGKRPSLEIYAHIAWTCFDFKPGESVAIPKLDIGFFSGDSIAGSNALRRHIVRHIRRPVKGGSPLPPVFYNHYYGFGDGWDAKVLKREADAYAQLGMEYFVVDAGWFEGGFRKGVGNWEKEDKKRFPEGMEEFARYVESKGMKFGSWLEIEYAMEGSDWAKRHPDWFHRATGQQNYLYGTRRFEDLLLRLQDTSVRKSVADFMERWVKKYHIQWLRWDFNDGPAPFWWANEEEERMGWLQAGYGEGLLALMDDFMQRCPQVHIEACAGGGHRMDLGTLRRAHSAWMNDNSITYDVMRRFQAGLNRVLPGNYGNSCFLWITHPHHRQQSVSSIKKGYPPTILRSRMGGSLGFAEQSIFWSKTTKAQLRKEIERYKAIRRFLMEDYYPLFNPSSLGEYDGWQFHDPASQEGFFMVFRCKSKARETEVFLPGLSRGLTYELEDVDTGRRRKVRGGRPLKVRIEDTDGTRWFTYKVKA